MKKQEMLNDPNKDLDNREIWYNTKDPNFVDLCTKSRVTGSWMSYHRGLTDKYFNAPIKPISNYVSNIGYEPSLVSVNNNTIKIRFYLYADMFLLKKDEKELYHVDRTWIRQYYLTNYKMNPRKDCFEETFKLYVPWILDEPCEVVYKNIEEHSPIFIEETVDYWHGVPPGLDALNPHMIPFMFKKEGAHMEDEELGIPRRGDPIFDMEAVVSDIMVERIKEYYANN